MSNLELAINLIAKVQEENKALSDVYKLTNLVNISFIKKFDELEVYCDVLEGDLAKAESVNDSSDKLTKRLMSTCGAVESLTDDNEDLKIKLSNALKSVSTMSGMTKKIADQSTAIRGLEVYKRKSDVLAEEVESLKAKLLKATSSPIKQVKAEKPSSRYKKMERLYDNQVAYTQELLEWGEASPRYTETLHHSAQGMIDVIDLKIEESDVSEVGSGEKTIEKCQRFIVLNKFNDMKMVTRVIGQDGMHRTKTPKGMTVKIDKEVLAHIDDHINKAAVVSGHIAAYGKQLKKAGKR